MSKVKIEVEIVHNGENERKQYTAVKSQNHYVYPSDSDIVKIIFNPNMCLIRENEEGYSKLVFDEHVITKGEYRLKQENIMVPLEIQTKQLCICEHEIYIQYVVLTTGQEVVYQLKEVIE